MKILPGIKFLDSRFQDPGMFQLQHWFIQVRPKIKLIKITYISKITKSWSHIIWWDYFLFLSICQVATNLSLILPITATQAFHAGHVQLLGGGQTNQVVHLDCHLQHWLWLRHCVSLDLKIVVFYKVMQFNNRQP